MWLALPVAAAVHGALEAHEFCQQHQAFEHVRDSTGAVSHDGDSIASMGSSDVHEDCSFDDALLRDATRVEAPIATVSAASLDLHALVANSSDVVAAILDAAPKTSPPTLFV